MGKFIKAYGAIPSPKDIRDYRGVATVSAKVLPETFELDMPPVKSQGSVGSCVAHAISTVVEYFSRTQGDDDRTMSTGYIYGNRTNSTHKGVGMVTREALQVTTMYGDVPRVLFPYNVEVPEAIEYFEHNVTELFNKGVPNRITEYYALNSVNDIKASLMSNGPVILVIDMYADMAVDAYGVLHTNYKGYEGSHCMVIYGWDVVGWKVQNSWNTSWGNKGRCIIPFDIKLSETWGIIDTFSENQNKLRIQKLNEENNELRTSVKELQQRLDLVLEQLDHARQDKELESQERLNVINDLNRQIEELNDKLTTYDDKIKEKNLEIEALQNELIEIKKPYDSPMGQIIAKIVNTIISAFSYLVRFIKRAFRKK